MCDAIYVYIIYLYVVRTVITAVVQAVFPSLTPEEQMLWVDSMFVVYLNLHYLFVFWVRGNDGDVNALIVLNLTTIFVVDMMSVISTFQNKNEISQPQFSAYLIAMGVGNLSWFFAWWFLCKGGNEGFFAQNDEHRVEVNDQGNVVDNRAVDRNSVEKINYIFYQPYYRLRNKTCSICIVEYEIDEAISVLPVCHHTFHKEWISEWLVRNSTCPFCRRHISRSDVDNEHENNMDDILFMIKKSTAGQEMAANFR